MPVNNIDSYLISRALLRYNTRSMYTVLLPMLAGSDSMGTLLSEFQATIDPVKFDEEAAKVDIGDVVAGLSKDIWGKY